MNAVELINQELNRACRIHPTPIRSACEAWGIIREEYLEMEQYISHSKEHKEELKTELIHLAAMCARTIEDLDL